MFQFDGGSLIDLSHPLRDGDRAYPGDPGITYDTVHSYDENGYQVSLIEMGSHIGTHLDAPRHIDGSGRTVDELDLARLVGPATIVDVDLSAGSSISTSTIDLDVGTLEGGERLLFRTGWGSRWHSSSFFTDFPDLDLDLARALAGAGVALIGLEQPSVHRTLHKEVHASLLGEEVVVVEGMTSLDRLRSKRVFLMCLPLPHVGLDGAAVRAVAWDPEGTS